MNATDTRLGRYFGSRRERGRAGLPTLSVTLDRGLVRRDSLERKMDTALAPQEHLLVRPGDIAYNMMRMWQGASGLAEEEALVSPAYVVLAPKEEVDPCYAAYLFKLPEMVHRFWSYSYGLTDDRLRLYYNDFKRIPREFPPLPQQKKITEILSTWDKAIEITERLLANTEAQKRALMQQLLTARTRLKEFRGREWSRVSVGQMGNIVGGGTPDSNDESAWGGSINWATPTDVTRVLGRYIDRTDRMLSQKGLKESAAKLLPAGSLLVCTRATIGEMAIATEPIATNQGFKSIVPHPAFNVEYLYHLLTLFKHDLVRYACGSTFLELSKKDFATRAFLVPLRDEQDRIAEIINAVEDEIRTLQHRRACLHVEKRALMQQLLTGRRRVMV